MQALLGIIVGISVLVLAHSIEGGSFVQLLNLPAAIIVIGGTLAAAAVQSPKKDFGRAMKLILWALREEPYEVRETIDRVKAWCRSARVSGLVALEREIPKSNDPFERSSLQLLADAQSAAMVRSVLETELARIENRDMHAARVVESMGGYAPTLGILGAVLGLIQVMSNLTDPSVLGSGIATAFVATIYGVGIANLMLLPLSKKIKRMIIARSEYYELIMDGVSFIAEGHTPGDVEQRLKGYLEESYAKAPTH